MTFPEKGRRVRCVEPTLRCKYGRQGTIAGRGRGLCSIRSGPFTCWWVKWDDYVSHTDISMNFVEFIDD